MMWYELTMGEVYLLFKPIKTAASIKSGFEEEVLINQEWEGALIAQFVPPGPSWVSPGPV